MNFELNDTLDNVSIALFNSQKDDFHVSPSPAISCNSFSQQYNIENHVNAVIFDDSSYLTLQNNENLEENLKSDCVSHNESLTSISSICFDKSMEECNASASNNDFCTSAEDILNSRSSFLNRNSGSILSNILDETSKNPHDNKELAIVQSRRLCDWGLPRTFLEQYAARNISEMFDWQVECLNLPNVLRMHKNIVYSAPTSAGKTLVAEILAIKTVLERRKKVIVILPFVSVVREKMYYFQEIFTGSGVRVEGFMGGHSPPGGFQFVQLAVCTIEKANGILNKLLLDGDVSQIGAVIVDEIHLMGDPHRGYILELLLTKLLYVTRHGTKVDKCDIQIIGMSATIPNLGKIADWLDAELYTTEFRPIPLHERACINGELFDRTFSQTLRKLLPCAEIEVDTDFILQLCLETISDSCSVLIFCPTKNWCENLALQTAQAFWKLGQSASSEASTMLRIQLNPVKIESTLIQLKNCPVGLDQSLAKVISFGVAFHHAGLTLDERDIIEESFKAGVIRVLIATSTLSSGVNLPAKRVIVRTPVFRGKPIDALTYRQMIGRSGRMGKDTSGESILICQKTDINVAKSLMSADLLEEIYSCLEESGRFKRALLEIIASGMAACRLDVDKFASCTLWCSQNAESKIAETVTNTLDFLTRNQFVRCIDTTEEGIQTQILEATQLALACLSSSLPPEDGLTLLAELDNARQCFVLNCELHLIYLVTPFSVCHQWGDLDWMLYLDLWESMAPSVRKVADLVGVMESYIVSATRGRAPNTSTPKLYHRLLVHKRFFIAMALQQLVDEVTLTTVAQKFRCNKGMLQSLQLTASTFAGMVTAFCKQLGWTSIALLIEQFQCRLHFGVHQELVDLLRLPTISDKRCGRALFNGGIDSLAKLAASDIGTIESILKKTILVQSTPNMADQENHTFVPSGINWITDKNNISAHEAAKILVASAREYLQLELGIKDAKWATEISPNSKGTHNIPKVSLVSTNNSTVADDQQTSDQSLFEDSAKSDYLDGTNGKTPYNNSLPNPPNAPRKRHMLSDNSTETPKKRKTPMEFMKRNTIMETFEIITVTEFDIFSVELKRQQCISIAFAFNKLSHLPVEIGKAKTTLNIKEEAEKLIDGIAICWTDSCIVYYVQWAQTDLIMYILNIINGNERLQIRCFNWKSQVRSIFRHCHKVLIPVGSIQDPAIGHWLLDSEGKELSLSEMIEIFCPELEELLSTCNLTAWSPTFGLDIGSATSARQRSSVEAALVWHLAESIEDKLFHTDPALLSLYELEMNCLKLVHRIEVNGIGVDVAGLKQLIHMLRNNMKQLEDKVYTLVGRRLSLSSSKQVAQILNLQSQRSKKKCSTAKDVLSHCNHPAASVIVQWRRLHFILRQTVEPLLRASSVSSCGEDARIHAHYIIRTSTGRISMHEPNLQSVARTFDVACLPSTYSSKNDIIENIQDEINCRKCFIPRPEHIFLSADYCQLELRILTHITQDKNLSKIMRDINCDVFRSIAADWYQVDVVNEDLRRSAKQICYGIIYGMGKRALATHMNTTVDQAQELMESFRNRFSNLMVAIDKIIQDCCSKGYIETLKGRRRYLPNITSSNTSLKKQAERQAVNSTIQGTAADLVKHAMVQLEKIFESMTAGRPYLVLHLHDELLYEVPVKHLREVAVILKSEMQQAINLSIPFPVKLKYGSSWGALEDYNV